MRIFLVLFLILHLIPVWAFPFFPSKDGPTHLYNAIALRQFADHANYLIRSAYQLNLTVFPNWTYSLIALPLLPVFAPLVVEKIILSLAIGFFPLSFLYFHSSVTGKLRVFSLLGFLFSYNYLLIMGFFNFALACSLLFVTLGFWYRRRDAFSVRHVGILYLLLLALFLSHVTPFFLFLLSSSFLLLSRAVRRNAWASGEGSIFHRLRMAMKPFLEWTCVLAPAWFLLLGEAIKRARDPYYMSTAWLLDYFLRFKSLVYFSNYRWNWGLLLLSLFCCAVVITALHWLRQKEARDDSIDFLLLGAPLLFLFFYVPWGYGPGGWTNGGWGNERIHLFLFLLVSPWLNVEFHRWIRSLFGGVLTALCLVHLGWTAYDIARIQPEIEQARSLCRSIPEHSTFGGSGQSVQPGMSDFLSPAYCGLERRDVLLTANYEAGVDLFPLMWRRPPAGNPEYKIVWNQPAESVASNAYEVLAQSGQTLLLKLRSGVENQIPDSALPAGFDLEPQPGLTPAGYISAGPDRVFQPGGFGWLAELRSPVTGRVPTSSNDAGMLIGDYLGAREDGVFIVSLPNGNYEISCFFFSGDGGSHTLSLIANDQIAVSDLEIPAGQYRKVVYDVPVKNGRLVQVIYSRQGRSRNPGLHDHWIWSGFSVKPSGPH